jgi:hypothetical protein
MRLAPLIQGRGPLRYAAYYITRGSLTYVAPLMVSDPQLGLTLPQVSQLPAKGLVIACPLHRLK